MPPSRRRLQIDETAPEPAFVPEPPIAAGDWLETVNVKGLPRGMKLTLHKHYQCRLVAGQRYVSVLDDLGDPRMCKSSRFRRVAAPLPSIEPPVSPSAGNTPADGEGYRGLCVGGPLAGRYEAWYGSVFIYFAPDNLTCDPTPPDRPTGRALRGLHGNHATYIREVIRSDSGVYVTLWRHETLTLHEVLGELFDSYVINNTR